jgi:AIPR protein
MRPEALRATDPIHGYIEELFRANGLYYDWRPGKHKDDGRPINQIVSILGLLQTMMAIILQRPQDAYGAPGRYIREYNEYYSVFSQELHPPTLFLQCIQIQRKVDDYLDELDLDRGHRPRLRFYMAMFVTCLATKSSHSTKDLILDLNIASIDKKTLDDAYKQVNKRYSQAGGDNLAAKGPKIVQGLQRVLKKRFPNAAPSN